jgi:hypothetical protein
LTLCVFRLGEPFRYASDSDALCRLTVLHKGFHPFAAPFPAAETALGDSCSAKAVSASRPLRQRRGPDLERLPLVQPHLVDEVRCVVQHNRHTCRSPNTLSTDFVAPPCQGDGVPPPAALRHSPARSVSQGRRLPRREDASFQHLQPTCCHENPRDRQTPKLQAFTFPTTATFFALLTPLRYRNNAPNANRPRRRRIAVAGISDPEWLCRWCCASQRQSPPPSPLPFRVEGRPSQDATRPGLLDPNEPGDSTTNAPCHTVHRSRFPETASQCQNRLPAQPTTVERFFGPERLPPMSPTCRAPCSRSGPNLRAATDAPTWPPKAQLPTCFHARTSTNARLSYLPGSHQSSWATCRPPTSAIVRSTSTPPSPPDPRRFPATANCCAPRQHHPCGQHQPDFPRLGVVRSSSANPRRSDRSPQRIYPNLIDPDTSCRELVPDSNWIESNPAAVRYTASFERTHPAHHAFA